MGKIKRWFGIGKEAVKRFFYEICRPHSKEEYAALLAARPGEAPKKTYPWFWTRVLLLTTTATALLFWTYKIKVGFGYVVAVNLNFWSSAFLSLVFGVLLFEMVRNSDWHFPSLLAGSFCLSTITFLLLWCVHLATGDLGNFGSSLRAGVAEEICKALPCILLLVLAKKKKPGDGFVLGAFGGMWFSILETMGKSPQSSVSTAFVRNLVEWGAGHILFTAVICWAFLYFSHSWRNFRFWGVVFLAMLGHAVWDWNCYDIIPCIPGCSLRFCDVLYDVLNHGTILGLAVFAIRRSNRWGKKEEAAPENTTVQESVSEEIPAAADAPAVQEPPRRPAFSYRRRALICGMFALILVNLLGLGCLQAYRETGESSRLFEKWDYGTLEEFRDWYQMGREIPIREHRPLDSSGQYSWSRYEEGELVGAGQKEILSETEYLEYSYYSPDPEDSSAVFGQDYDDVDYYFLPEGETEYQYLSETPIYELLRREETEENAFFHPIEVFYLRDYIWDDDIQTEEEPPHTVVGEITAGEDLEQTYRNWYGGYFLDNGRVVSFYLHGIHRIPHRSFWVYLGGILLCVIGAGVYIPFVLTRAKKERKEDFAVDFSEEK